MMNGKGEQNRDIVGVYLFIQGWVAPIKKLNQLKTLVNSKIA